MPGSLVRIRANVEHFITVTPSLFGRIFAREALRFRVGIRAAYFDLVRTPDSISHTQNEKYPSAVWAIWLFAGI